MYGQRVESARTYENKWLLFWDLKCVEEKKKERPSKKWEEIHFQQCEHVPLSWERENRMSKKLEIKPSDASGVNKGVWQKMKLEKNAVAR